MSFFTGLSEAERYAQSRPYFHPIAIDRAFEALGLERDISLALDIACGTGQSAVALLGVANRVIGADVSRSMLAHAARHPRLQYLQARAEELPFGPDNIPLMTTALAFHWFDRARFLSEANRVLRARAWLLVYNNAFRGIMKENEHFQEWGRNVYLNRFPTPPRDIKPLTPEDAAQFGFEFVEKEDFENEVQFNPRDLVAYLTTQTNVAAAIGEGRESLETAYSWLLAQVQSFFDGRSGTFVFWTTAWYLRKVGAR